MSAKPTKANEKVADVSDRKNIFLRVPPEMKNEVKKLASASGMTTEAWCVAVIRDAVSEMTQYRPVKVKKYPDPA